MAPAEPQPAPRQRAHLRRRALDAAKNALYGYVLGSVPAEFWTDAWDRPACVGLVDDNVALGAAPIGSVKRRWALIGAVAELGRFLPPKLDPKGAYPWFGLSWDAPQTIGRLVAHTGGWDPEVASWTDAQVQARLEGEDRRTSLDAQLVRDGPTWTFTLQPTAVSAVRLVAEGEHDVICRELEAYAQ